MTFIETTIKILQESTTSLTAGEIAESALSSSLVRTSGRTPEASMSAALYTELGRPESRVEKIATNGRTRASRRSVRWTAL